MIYTLNLWPFYGAVSLVVKIYGFRIKGRRKGVSSKLVVFILGFGGEQLPEAILMLRKHHSLLVLLGSPCPHSKNKGKEFPVFTGGIKWR